MSIHPTAIISPDARLGSNVQIGPYCIVEADVEISDGCVLENHAVIKSGTTLGRNNRLFESTVIGAPPQHTEIPERTGRVEIGDNNIFREYATVHRALKSTDTTRIGNNCLLMVNSHVAHDCELG